MGNGKGTTSTGCLPRRTLSMRLPKSKKKGNTPSHAANGVDQTAKRTDVTDSPHNLDASAVNEQLLSRRRKRKLKSHFSLLKFFPFVYVGEKIMKA